ncbi:MAG: hypothetical protein JRE23_03190 [Deltaproteobacteria bacterium]|nr:hypothetical protein [Deltaproteobacteria bacterium]
MGKAPSNTEVLKSKALMVRLVRKKLNRNKMDKDLGVLIRDLKSVTESSAVRVNKSLFSKSCTDAYMKVYNDGSKYFYRVTLPWDDRGWRLLSIELFEDFQKTVKKYTKDYRAKVMDFIEHIDGHIEEAKKMLGEAFSIDDYKFLASNGSVDQEYLLDQFSFEIEFNTVTSGDDLRASLTEDDREIIADQINKQATENFARANEHIITSLHECILAIHERLCNDENVFRDTLVTNLEDLCDLIPKMNIAGDIKINELAADAKAKLTKWEPAILREVPSIRKDVSNEAKKILKGMEGLI